MSAFLSTVFSMEMLVAIWETFYITILATAFALLLGIPLGVLLVAGEKGGVLPLPISAPAWMIVLAPITQRG